MTNRLTAAAPWRNDGVTIAGAVGPVCEMCGRAFPPAGRRRFCSDACRQTAFRRRQVARNASQAPTPPPPVRAPKPATVYECPTCGVRLLGEQRCAECGVFCRRIGPGGNCPHCDEPVAIADLITSGCSDPGERSDSIQRR
jgi:hypothetical protein